MKFKCKICGQQIDNPYICPYCGSGSDHIILIDEDEEEELKEEVTEEKLDETYEDESSYETNSNEENEDQEIDDNSSNISNKVLPFEFLILNCLPSDCNSKNLL